MSEAISPEQAAPDSAAAPPRKHRWRSAVRDASAAFVLTVVGLLVVGVLWGFTVPRYRGTKVSDAALSLQEPSSTAFSSYLWFALFTALAGLLVGWLGRRFLVTNRGIVMMCWLCVCSLVGATAAHTAGTFVSALVFMPVAPDSLGIGDSTTVVKEVAVGVSGLLVAPFFTAVTYWVMIIAGGASGPGDADETSAGHGGEESPAVRAGGVVGDRYGDHYTGDQNARQGVPRSPGDND